MRLFTLLAAMSALLISAPARSDAIPAPAKLAVGPVSLGMSVEALKAATPGVTWGPWAWNGLASDRPILVAGEEFMFMIAVQDDRVFFILAQDQTPLADSAACLDRFKRLVETWRRTAFPDGSGPNYAGMPEDSSEYWEQFSAYGPLGNRTWSVWITGSYTAHEAQPFCWTDIRLDNSAPSDKDAVLIP